MAKATVKETRIPQPPIMQPVPQPDKVERTIVLELSEAEAVAIRLVLGKRVCNDDSGVADTSSVFHVLGQVGIYTASWNYGIKELGNTSWKFIRR